MTVVQELDQRLFDGYVQPKAAVVKGIVRDGILDTNMDWYETPQPTGISSEMFILSVGLINRYRNTTVHVRNPNVPRERPRGSKQGGRTSAGPDSQCLGRGSCGRGVALFPSSQTFWHGGGCCA